MIQFLRIDLTAIIRDIMSHFVKKEVLEHVRSICKIDRSKENNLLA